MAEIECRRSRKGIFPVFGFAQREEVGRDGRTERGRGRERMRGRRSFSLSEYNPRSVYKQPPCVTREEPRRPDSVAFTRSLMGMGGGGMSWGRAEE